MYLRPKTTRRLLIIGVVMAVLVGIGGTIWAINTRKNAERIAKAREDAMAAFAKGDHASALPHFDVYLTGSKTAEKAAGEADTEALLAYGKSRQAIALPRGRHVVEAIYIFETYLRLKPGDREAQHLLLKLYPDYRYNEEALNLANLVLASDPKDAVAVRAKMIALQNTRKTREALAAAEDLVKLLPTDIEAHAHLQELTMRLAQPGDEQAAASKALVERYKKLLAGHTDDPRFELLLARAYHFADEPDQVRQWLKTAAARDTTDPETAQVLTSLLEQYNLYAESNRVLERLAGAQEDAVHLRPLVQRLWQSDRDRDVLKRTEPLDPESPKSDTELLAYRALALYDLNRTAEAGKIVDALEQRKDDMAAGAWAMALRARENENLAPKQRVSQYKVALERLPGNEVFYFMLGEAYFALGESEPALAAWREAARRAPSWAAPTSAIARTLAATGRSAEALAYAHEARRRSPQALGTNAGLAVALFAEQQQNPTPEAQRQLLTFVERIQQQFPREPETLHIYAALLSRTGQRDKSAEVIQAALAAETPPPRDTLLALAAVSYAEKLGLEGKILDAAERAHGMTPSVAIRKAVLLSQAGKPQEGLKLLETARGQDAASDPVQWTLAVLQYRESMGDDAVLGEWVRLGDANPDNALVQSAVLRSPSRTGDKAFWLRSIDRLKKLAGEDAVVPRVERARWLLAGDTSLQEAAEVIFELGALKKTALPEINRLLGLAHEKSAAHKSGAEREDLLMRAAEELEQAFRAHNADPGVATDLTRVLRALGNNVEADKVMSRVADRAAELGVDGKKRTARTLIAQGQLTKAVAVLEPVGDGQDVERDALLCSLYRRTGANDKAAALYRKLLADGRVEPATVADGADFFAAQGKADEAEKFLARLRSMDVAPARREMLLARYAELRGTPDEARKGYEAAVTADASYPAAWQALVGHHLRRLQFPEAIAAAERGLKALPDDPDLVSLRARAQALQTLKQDPNLEAVAQELSNDPQSGAITEMLRVLSEARRTNQPLKDTIATLRKLADQNPDLLRLQAYVAQGYARLGQFDEAEAVAARAARRAPNDPDAARLLMSTYAARPGDAKWPKVLEAARQWRQRSLDNPLPADMTIARTLIEMRRFPDAADQLKPHVIEKAGVKPNVEPAVMQAYAHALIGAARDREAAALLTPLAKSDAKWRLVWLHLGAVAFEDAGKAVAWTEQVVPMLSAGDAKEQLALAEAWTALGTRRASAPALEKAKAVLEPLTAGAGADSKPWQLLARVGEASGDMALTVRAYRKLLEAQADNPDLQNNLAYALLGRGEGNDLADARKLAEAAVARAPTNSTYLDTLARVHLKAGDLDAAGQTFQRALDAEQSNMDAMIGLADVHARAGRTDVARDLLARINDALQGAPALPASLQRQLDAVRQSVKPPVQSGRLE